MLFKKTTLKKIFISLGSHLGLCAIFCFIGWLISLIPGAPPYVIGPVATICLIIMLFWGFENFGLKLGYVFIGLLLAVALIIAFLLGVSDWVFGLDVLPLPWRYVAVFESLPLAFIIIYSLGAMLEMETTPQCYKPKQ